VTAKGPQLFGILEIGPDPAQAEQVDLMALGLEVLEEVIEPQFIAVVGRVRNEGRQDEDIQSVLSF
jgi:hypothetical protein